MKNLVLPIAAALGFASLPAQAENDRALASALRQRLDGDRSGACIAAAVIEGRSVRRAVVCADPSATSRITPDTAFEIGSVSKTMAATLLARLVGEGKASLDDPLAKHLPPDSKVPAFEGRPILLRHVVTHTSGLPALPPGMAIPNPEDPYAAVKVEDLLAALSRTTLTHAPGAQAAYSNFAMMLLSHAVARTAGRDFETLLAEQLFAPVGMRGAYVRKRPASVRAAQGHLSNGRPTPAWNIPVNVAGVGGVRATLDDMIRYAQAQLHGSGDAKLDAAIALTRQPIPLPGGQTGAMNWMRPPWRGGSLFVHEGGTGGFSALVAFVPEQQRGVVLLSDTALHPVGGLGLVGMHLLDARSPMPAARRVTQAPAALLEALAGEYDLGGMRIRLWSKDGKLHGQVPGQQALEFAHDSNGDFFPLAIDALLSPQRQADGSYGFSWMQGGGVLQARRVGAAPARAAYAVPADVIDDYTGTYPLVPGFALDFSVRDGRLYIQATGQSALPLDAVAKDVFLAAMVGAELTFERNPSGKVVAVTLRQNGQVLRGERAP